MPSDRDHVLQEAAIWYIRVVEDNPGPEVEEAFVTWLEAAPAHAACWRDIVATADGIGQTRPQDQALGHRYTGKMLSPSNRPAAGRRRFWSRKTAARPILAAASAAIVIGVLLIPDALLYLRADALTSTAEVRAVRLADGSRVILGPESAMAAKIAGNQRSVRLLQGVAWFEVAPDKTRPFRVTADHATATVLGTRFEVRTAGQDSVVSVEQGRVRVTDDEGTGAAILTAGYRAVFSADGHHATGRATAPSFGAWREGEIIVQNGTVADVIEELRPWYRGRIMMLGPRLSSRRVSGFYRTDDPVRSIRNLVATYGGRVTMVTPWLVIVTDR